MRAGDLVVAGAGGGAVGPVETRGTADGAVVPLETKTDTQLITQLITHHTSQQDGQHVLVYPPSHVSFSATLYFTSFTYFKNHNLNHMNVRYFNQTLDILKQEHINCLYFTRMKILYVKCLYTVENILLLLLITTLYCLLLSTSTY